MTKAEKSWAMLVERTKSEAKYKVGDRVKYDQNGEVYAITEVRPGVFGGVEYGTKSLESDKIGLGFESKLIAV